MAGQASSVSIKDGMVHVDGQPILFAIVGRPGDASVRFIYAAPSPLAALPTLAAFVEQFRMLCAAEYIKNADRLVQPAAPGALLGNGAGG